MLFFVLAVTERKGRKRKSQKLEEVGLRVAAVQSEDSVSAAEIPAQTTEGKTEQIKVLKNKSKFKNYELSLAPLFKAFGTLR